MTSGTNPLSTNSFTSSLDTAPMDPEAFLFGSLDPISDSLRAWAITSPAASPPSNSSISSIACESIFFSSTASSLTSSALSSSSSELNFSTSTLPASPVSKNVQLILNDIGSDSELQGVLSVTNSSSQSSFQSAPPSNSNSLSSFLNSTERTSAVFTSTASSLGSSRISASESPAGPISESAQLFLSAIGSDSELQDVLSATNSRFSFQEPIQPDSNSSTSSILSTLTTLSSTASGLTTSSISRNLTQSESNFALASTLAHIHLLSHAIGSAAQLQNLAQTHFTASPTSSVRNTVPSSSPSISSSSTAPASSSSLSSSATALPSMPAPRLQRPSSHFQLLQQIINPPRLGAQSASWSEPDAMPILREFIDSTPNYAPGTDATTDSSPASSLNHSSRKRKVDKDSE